MERTERRVAECRVGPIGSNWTEEHVGEQKKIGTGSKSSRALQGGAEMFSNLCDMSLPLIQNMDCSLHGARGKWKAEECTHHLTISSESTGEMSWWLAWSGQVGEQ